MPKITVVRTGVTPYARKVPTDTTPIRIDDVSDAFVKFQPSCRFETKVEVGEKTHEFVAELEFRSLEDFKPQNIQQKIEGKHNDIADLQSTIELLYFLKDYWTNAQLKSAWNNPLERKKIINSLKALRSELEKVKQLKGAK
jgi:predicted component of type VI protein secretion system